VTSTSRHIAAPRRISSIGDRSYLLPGDSAAESALLKLIAQEEARILRLPDVGVTTPEYMLVHFVRMYTLRWALPVVEIECGGNVGERDVDAVRQRLWLCLYGRAIDDLTDRDGRFFTVADSIVVANVYGSLLHRGDGPRGELEELRRIHLACSEKSGGAVSAANLSFETIRDNICERVAYFVDRSEFSDRNELVRWYVATLLARCDLDDAIADGALGPSATPLSRSLRAAVADDEEKVPFGPALWQWYSRMTALIRTTAAELLARLHEVPDVCAAHVVEAALREWDESDSSMPIDSRTTEGLIEAR
jgi:hypothetical protein